MGCERNFTDAFRRLSLLAHFCRVVRHETRVGTVVVGDLTGIRERIGYGDRMNQRLHKWAYSKFKHMLTCKAQLRG
ncbi:IS200/IS605 family accessory protein TnpB-related protein [Salinibacter ruber]|uniref:IS200/IS605 family accessory protein TnpB-related protein n=1 Tax=Salinibacter ruber TaxID=146919 RepID=UPI00311AAE7E